MWLACQPDTRRASISNSFMEISCCSWSPWRHLAGSCSLLLYVRVEQEFNMVCAGGGQGVSTKVSHTAVALEANIRR